MISVGRRDVREERIIGFGGGGGRRDMEETELEEGEACSYNNNLEEEEHDYGSEMDPDIDFSYIDEKLQNVLGHFQKDFEGGVSAENLGAKFGGYGSFLPTYQRSPVLSHSRSPPKAQPLNASRSPHHLQLEGGHRSSVSSTNTVQSGRLKTSFSVAASLPESKTPSSLFDSVKPEVGLPSSQFSEEFGSSCEIANRNSDNSSDLKMLKVRIKVGSDNLSTRKNAAIYSGLGLDVSPSSSLDGNTSESEGMPNEPHGALESPCHIIQMMTVFPVQGDRLLSPLGNDFIQLTKEDRLLTDCPSFPLLGTASQSFKSAADAYDFVEDDGKKSGEKKIKSLASDNISEEITKDSNDFRSAVHGILRKDADVDTLACEELVSNTLKLPLLSSSHTAFSGMGKMDRSSPMSKESKGVGKDRTNLKKEEPSVQKITTEDFVIKNSKATSGGKISEVRKISSVTHVTDGCEEDGNLIKGKADSNVDEGRKAQSSKHTVPPKQKSEQKTSACELEVTKLASAKEDSGTKKKKVSKKHGNLVANLPKESLGVESMSTRNCVNSRHTDECETKGKVKDTRLHNNNGIGDRYKDFFGDLELQLDENQISESDISGNGRLDGSEFERRRPGIDDTINERTGRKQIDKLSTCETNQAALRSALHTTDGPVSDAAPAASASGAAEDNWVCCDKCQKWRLLPLGKNPNDLPEKWICSMLNWLPGMNHCRFSEEETTNALIALYHASAPESKIGLQKHTGAVKSRDNMEDVWRHDHNQQSIGSHGMPVGGKKQGLKEQSSTLPKEGSTQFSNPVRKNKQTLLANGHENNVRQSTLTSEPDMRLGNASDMTVERHRNKRKDKYKDLQSHSDKDDRKRSKMKDKGDSDQDFVRTSKKVKTDHPAEEWISNNDGTIVKAGPGSGKSYLHTSLGKNMSKRNDRSSSKDSRYELMDGAQVSYKRPRDGDINSLDDKSLDKRKLDDRDTLKKRKTKEGSYLGSLNNSGPHLHDNRVLEKDLSENEYRKKKKVRLSRSEGKETSSGTGNCRTEKSNHKRSQQAKVELRCTMTQQSMDGSECFKRDSGTLLPSLAATSSSSKVSGSHKTKASFHDSKGSPVESVSSSPLRVSKPEKLMSATANIAQNDDSIGVGLKPPGGLKRCPDAEDDGRSNRFGITRKENTPDVAYHDSLESVVIDHQEKTSSHLSGGEAKVDITPSPNATIRQCSNGEHKQCPGESASLDRCHDDGRQKDDHHQLNKSHQVKPRKELSLWSRDRKKNSSSEFDNGKDKVPDSVGEQVPSSGVKQTNGQNKVGVRYDENQDEYVNKKDSARQLTSENSKRENQSQCEVHNGTNVKIDAIGSHESTSASKKCLLQDCEAVSGKNTLSLGAQGQKLGYFPENDPSSQKVVGSDKMADNVPGNENMLRAEKQVGKVGHSNGMQNGSSRNLLSNGHRIKEDAPSAIKRDSSSQAATNAMKEAKNLKHKADRLKNSGMTLESTRLYFEAVLNFLHGASLLETCSNDSAKNGEMIRSMQMYSSTAKLCAFCAHEYEKSKDMAAAALAYKCMEVAYMRVVYGSHTIANRDRRELQGALQMVPPGESPSSSASDIDNFNHTMGEKGTLSKGTSSPQVSGSHVIAASSRPSFVRLLHFAQDVNFAMEASRKSQTAFAAAVVNLGEDGILSVKKALDFNFQDVEGLLRLVRLAFDSISN